MRASMSSEHAALLKAVRLIKVVGSDAATHADRRRALAWLEKSSENVVAYQRAVRIAFSGEDPHELPNRSECIALVRVEVMKEKAATANRRKKGGIMVVSIVVVGLAVSGVSRFWNPFTSRASGDNQQVISTTDRPEKRHLNDGSSVYVDAHSQVIVNFDNGRRGVDVQKGGARFEVAKNSRAFEVDASGTLVTAISTKFSVAKAGADRVEVSVSRGAVHIRPKGSTSGQAAKLAANQTAFAEKGLVRSVITLNADDGKVLRIKFTQEALGNAIDVFNLYNIRKIHLFDPARSLRPVTGTFPGADPELFVSAVSGSHDLNVTRAPGSDDLYLSGKN